MAQAKEKKGKDAKPAAAKATAAQKVKFDSEFQKKYETECRKALKESFGYTNPMQIPKIEKIVLNTCLKEALNDAKVLHAVAEEVGAITAQKAVVTRAKKSIANFKLRAGQAIGVRVTLRGKHMYEFMNRLVNIALPRVKDFKGVSKKAFDGRGNYTLGLTDQSIFPEVNFDRMQVQYGMNITFVTSAKTDKEGRELLKLMGMPFAQ